MRAASQRFLLSVLKDLAFCSKYAGLPFDHKAEEESEQLAFITEVLDQNEKINGKNGLLKTADIFTHLYQSSETTEKEVFGSTAFNKLCKEWFEYSADESLEKLLGKAEKQLASLAMPFESGDISVYEHSRVTAAIASCLEGCEYDANSLSFLLFSIDLSGIQSFLYSIGNKGALKGLKTRSFYLGILIMHVALTILDRCGYSQLNLIYCGGGKAHLLLANNKENLQMANTLISQANQFLQQHFGTALYLASGYAEASLNDLASGNGETPCFAELFHKASAMISQKKLRRYTAAELLAFNSREEDYERECIICGNGTHLKERDGECICEDCWRFERFSVLLKYAPSEFAVSSAPCETCLELPFNRYLCAAGQAGKADYVYSVNPEHVGEGIPLYLGNYQPDSDEPVTFEKLGNASCGIHRLGIVRMDVDNLGSMFAKGFVDHSLDKAYRRVSLVRYSALSAAITHFFQCEINRIVANEVPQFSLTDISNRNRDISIVYSGGDDLFLAGAWDQVTDAALTIQEAFSRFTHGKASISGGIGLFGATEPIRIMAARCAELEDAAKKVPGKAAVTVFDSVYSFSWEEYSGTVLSKMLPIVEDLCSGNMEGNSFLYHVMALLKDISKNQIAIARLAYLLARHCPSGEAGHHYTSVANQLYVWALDQKHNKLLQCAILLYVYLHREGYEE